MVKSPCSVHSETDASLKAVWKPVVVITRKYDAHDFEYHGCKTALDDKPGAYIHQ